MHPAHAACARWCGWVELDAHALSTGLWKSGHPWHGQTFFRHSWDHLQGIHWRLALSRAEAKDPAAVATTTEAHPEKAHVPSCTWPTCTSLLPQLRCDFRGSLQIFPVFQEHSLHLIWRHWSTGFLSWTTAWTCSSHSFRPVDHIYRWLLTIAPQAYLPTPQRGNWDTRLMELPCFGWDISTWWRTWTYSHWVVSPSGALRPQQWLVHWSRQDRLSHCRAWSTLLGAPLENWPELQYPYSA